MDLESKGAELVLRVTGQLAEDGSRAKMKHIAGLTALPNEHVIFVVDCLEAVDMVES